MTTICWFCGKEKTDFNTSEFVLTDGDEGLLVCKTHPIEDIRARLASEEQSISRSESGE